ncbi:MAG: tRNA uridine-5-carboxymethylaminomethyl(34) synthesis GTPase MnmE [Gemmatimonadetes bacterium]|nr:tRNA uridine-5-carboxymethylaminomethyl(34) synthesis GTPase MnmE [Gemmatimonadota bacterium]MBI3504547.1 tRNA uridine-5-carboxymethylaminomethyl(34) synthesis GTPase MnmE [Pseudomonadota bacterium]
MSAPRRPPADPARPGALVRGDTIAAVASAPGRGAIAVVRLSGPDAVAIGERVCVPWPVAPRVATRRMLREPTTGATLDEALVTVFPAPHSYTGETVVEFATHGGSQVPDAVLAALVAAGARPAAPGEFSERAVLNGKLDLVRAEAIADLIDARSRAQHRTALRHLEGALSREFAALREAVLELDALLAYDIDFPEEDAGTLPRERIDASGAALLAGLDALLATVPAALLERDGATIVLAGPPNAGKSSLLNALVGEARVIVSELPGTTRDAVEVLLEHDPWPLRLVDTAGLRASDDPLERLGIEVSERYLARAHVVVVCAESPDALRAAGATIGARTTAPLVGALTKADLVAERYDNATFGYPVVEVSATVGTGLPALVDAVTTAVAAGTTAADEERPLVTRARHRAALTRARDEIARFRESWASGSLPAPVAAVHVRSAAHALDELIGVVDVDEVFGRVFSTFCVGK